MLRSIISKSVKRSFYRQAAPSSTLRDSISEEGASWSSLHNSITDHTDPRSTKPLLEQFRPRWPQPPITKLAEADEFPGIFPIPETRTIPASVLRFQMQASFSHGASLYYEHLHYNPADFKVTLRVSLKDLSLTEDEEFILIRMLAKRFNIGRRDITLISERFPNRIENKRYLVYLIENLVREAKKLAVIQKEMSDAIPTLKSHLEVAPLSESDSNIKSGLPL